MLSNDACIRFERPLYLVRGFAFLTGWQFESRGEQQVKNIARPVAQSEAHASPFHHGTGAGRAELLPASLARRFSDLLA